MFGTRKLLTCRLHIVVLQLTRVDLHRQSSTACRSLTQAAAHVWYEETPLLFYNWPKLVYAVTVSTTGCRSLTQTAAHVWYEAIPVSYRLPLVVLHLTRVGLHSHCERLQPVGHGANCCTCLVRGNPSCSCRPLGGTWVYSLSAVRTRVVVARIVAG